jgi:hypothetical protein
VLGIITGPAVSARHNPRRRQRNNQIRRDWQAES